MTPRRMRVAIVGAGISGLSAAHYLRRKAEEEDLDLQIDLFERSRRLGGVIRTERTAGFLLEHGPENFVSAKPAALRLIRELGLSDQVLGSQDRRRRVFLLERGRLRPLPEGLAFVVPMRLGSFWSSAGLSTRGKIRALAEPLIPPSRGELSVYRFLERRLGRELTERVGEPLVAAIFGGDVHRLSAAGTLPELHQMEQRYGSLWRGLRTRKNGTGTGRPLFMTLEEGMETVIRTLAAQLQGVSLYPGVAVTRVEPLTEGYRLQGTLTDQLYDRVVLSIPAWEAAALLEPVPGGASRLLCRIPYSSTVLVYLAYQRSELSHPLEGFGFVVPAAEATMLDACTWVSSKFERRSPPGTVLLRCAIHDGRQPRNPTPDEALAEQIHTHLKPVLGIRSAPLLCRVLRTRRVMPQYQVGHRSRLSQINRLLHQHPGIVLNGAYCDGLGVPDCIDRGARCARRIIDSFRQ